MVKRRIDIVRVYDDPGRKRGEHRVLIDRLWPRGVRKESLDYDEWEKNAAPGTELRRWYAHEPDRFAEFDRRYRAELGRSPASDALGRLRGIAAKRPLVLLTATRDVEHSGAKVLHDVLEDRR